MPTDTVLHAVYTAGKAATTTTHRTLARHLDVRIYDVRRATPEGVAEFKAFARQNSDRPLRTDDAEFVEVLAASPATRFRLVTLTREPVAAAVSSWFFNFDLRNPGVDPASWTVEKHVEAICKGGFASRPDFFTGWFDFECKPFTGIDVYATPFPHDRGWSTLQSDTTELLVVRCEDLDRVASDAFRAFFDIHVPALERHHVGEDSAYADVYRRFKAEAKLPMSFVESQLASRYARHFYTEQERRATSARWTGGAGG